MVLLAGAFALAACASIFGIHTGELEDAAAGDAGTDAIDDVPFDYVVHDAVDLDVNTGVCDGGLTLVGADAAVWVSGNAGAADQPSCGTQDSPCATLTYALSVRGTRSVVYADHATFEEALTLGATQANVTVQGGFVRSDAGWTAQCDTSLTTIQAPDDAGPSAVDITGTSGVTLRLLTIRSKTNGTLDESVYAVRVLDSTGVVLDNVSMLAQNGGQGTVGINGTTAPCITGGTGNATGGSPGFGGSAGAVGATGYVVTTAGTGGDGGNGTSGIGVGGVCTGPCITACQ